MTKLFNIIRRNKFRVACIVLAFTGATLFYAGENMIGFALCSLAAAIAAENLK